MQLELWLFLPTLIYQIFKVVDLNKNYTKEVVATITKLEKESIRDKTYDAYVEYLVDIKSIM